MLVLTRKRSELIRIGDEITIKVIQTGRGSVKLGIEAPNEVRVLRAELCSFGDDSSTSEGEHPAEPLTAEQFLEEFDAAWPELGDQFPVLPCADHDPRELLTTAR